MAFDHLSMNNSSLGGSAPTNWMPIRSGNRRPVVDPFSGTTAGGSAGTPAKSDESRGSFMSQFGPSYKNYLKQGGFGNMGSAIMAVLNSWGNRNTDGSAPTKKKPTNAKPPVTPPTTSTPLPPQWGNPTKPFPQNPYDIPAPVNAANNPWLASLPRRDWMLMPSASPGYEQGPPPAPWRPPYL